MKPFSTYIYYNCIRIFFFYPSSCTLLSRDVLIHTRQAGDVLVAVVLLLSITTPHSPTLIDTAHLNGSFTYRLPLRSWRGYRPIESICVVAPFSFTRE